MTTTLSKETLPTASSVYFERYLRIAPLSLAIWRSGEAQELAKHRLTKPVLDIGCGFGEFGGVFFSSQVEVGLDISPKEILHATSCGKYRKTIVADARDLPFKARSFGTVISISTLEHIPNNERVFQEVYRILKLGGRFYFSVPTNQLYSGLLMVKILRALSLEPLAHLYYRAINKAFKHVFLPSERRWLALAKNAGFTIESVSGTITPRMLMLFELGLPFSVPSQLYKILYGTRRVFARGTRVKLFRPLASYIRSDSDFRANIFVVATKRPRQ